MLPKVQEDQSSTTAAPDQSAGSLDRGLQCNPGFPGHDLSETCYEEFSGIGGLAFQQDELGYLPDSTITKNGKTYRNTTAVNYTKPLTMGYIAPSITPLPGNNAGYQLYQVDAKIFSITGVQTYFANVSESLTWMKPVWQFEYDARDTYTPAVSRWPKSSPLNATFWDEVTSTMSTDQRYVELYNLLERKSGVVTRNCSSSECAEMKVCYIHSWSAALGLQCPYGGGPF